MKLLILPQIKREVKEKHPCYLLVIYDNSINYGSTLNFDWIRKQGKRRFRFERETIHRSLLPCVNRTIIDLWFVSFWITTPPKFNCLHLKWKR